MEAPTVFTVGARGTRLKVECRIYKSQRDMLADVRRLNGCNVGADTAAMTEGTPSLMPRGRFAIIFFWHKHLTKGVVAHEMDHAAFCLFARRRKKDIVFHSDHATEAEEAHATIVGDLVDDFHRHYGA